MRLTDINYKKIGEKVLRIETYFDSDIKATIESHTIFKDKEILKEYELI